LHFVGRCHRTLVFEAAAAASSSARCVFGETDHKIFIGDLFSLCLSYQGIDRDHGVADVSFKKFEDHGRSI